VGTVRVGPYSAWTLGNGEQQKVASSALQETKNENANPYRRRRLPRRHNTLANYSNFYGLIPILPTIIYILENYLGVYGGLRERGGHEGLGGLGLHAGLA